MIFSKKKTDFENQSRLRNFEVIGRIKKRETAITTAVSFASAIFIFLFFAKNILPPAEFLLL